MAKGGDPGFPTPRRLWAIVFVNLGACSGLHTGIMRLAGRCAGKRIASSLILASYGWAIAWYTWRHPRF